MTRLVSLVELQALEEQLVDYYGPAKKHSKGSYELVCPLHGNQSLHLTVSDRIKLWCFSEHCNTKERHAELMERIKTDGFDVDVVCMGPEATAGNKKSGYKSHLIQNIPAHDQTPLDIRSLSLADGEGDMFPVTQAYPYTDKEGRVLFYQLRANTPKLDKKGKKIKVLKIYSSFHNSLTNTDTWEFSLGMKERRPLYNLKGLYDNPTKPVLLVEGEKACEAAKRLFPNYVCTCYPLGMANYRTVDFTPLYDRDVTLWPDNKEDAIKAFLSVAGLIEPTPKITFTVPLIDRPENWDVADELPNDAMPHDMLLRNAFVPKVSKVSSEDEIAIIEKYGAHLRLLWSGGDRVIYDNSITNPDSSSWCPYVFHPVSAIHNFYPEKIYDITKSKKPLPAIDAWLESDQKIISYGLTFDPSSNEELVKSPNGLWLTNKFMGWATQPKQCDPAKYMCFANHIRHIMDPISAEYLLSFIAHIIQDPKAKPGVIPVLIGKTVMGKTIIGKILYNLLGDKNMLITDGRTFNNKWTGMFSSKVLIFVNEYTNKGQDMDYINTLATDSTIAFEHKGKNIVYEPSYHRIIGTTNKGHFSLSQDDRRVFPIDVHNPSIDSFNKHNPNNKPYFAELDRLVWDEEGLAGLHYWLKEYEIKANVFAAPMTFSRISRLRPTDPGELAVLEMCQSGSMPRAFEYRYVGSGEYPAKILRKHFIGMLMDHYDYKGTATSMTQSLFRFFGPDTVEKRKNTQSLKFYRRGSAIQEDDRDRYFELPLLKELRARYNKHVDPDMDWGTEEPDAAKPSHLRIVPKDDETSK